MKLKHAIFGLSALAIVAGIFAIVAIPNVDSGKGQKVTQAKIELRTIRMAIDLFHAQEGRYPSNLEGLGVLVPKYLHLVPKDPWIRAYIYRYDGTGMPSVYSSGANGRDEHGEADDVNVK